MIDGWIALVPQDEDPWFESWFRTIMFRLNGAEENIENIMCACDGPVTWPGCIPFLGWMDDDD